VNQKRKILVLIVWYCSVLTSYSQDISLYQQFNGRYDFVFFGNSMNVVENSLINESVTLTASSAVLNLNSSNTIEKAYLYWAGSGDGDFEVNLNSELITPDRTFSHTRLINTVEFSYFSAFKDVTSQIQTTGNGTYTLSNLDISAFEPLHLTRSTNFAGWAIFVLCSNPSLPLNQINLYDGLQAIPDSIIINLTNLNILDTLNSKAAVLAWEGDAILPTESLSFNNQLLSNPQNPSNNVFNGSNSFTGSNALYNMDLDVYDIQNFIQIGDTTAQITASSTQDFVMINTVVTKLNNQVPDATVVINSLEKTCNSKDVVVNYTVSNFGSTNTLPSNVPVAIYCNEVLIFVTETNAPIPVEESATFQVAITLPDSIIDTFTLLIVVDDTGNNQGIISELIETNNTFTTTDFLIFSPKFNVLPNLISCNEGFTQATFDFSSYEDIVKVNITDEVRFYDSLFDAQNTQNAIIDPINYVASQTPKDIFVRIDNENCNAITSFTLNSKNCPPTVYNFVSANNDSVNDTFFIKGLRNIFLNFKLEVYNRWGRLVWTGNQHTEDWDGFVKEGFSIKTATEGTFFYLLYLNDSDYPEVLKGFLYITR
jgi:gliding motility-associated-like protein